MGYVQTFESYIGGGSLNEVTTDSIQSLQDRIKQLPPLIPLEGYCQTGGLPGWNGNIRNFPKREDQWWEDTIKREIFGEKQPLFNDARRITEWFKYNCSRYGDPAESFLRDPQILVLSILCRKIY